MTPIATRIERPHASQPRVTPPARGQRIRSVDIVRGAVMVLMALDHVRDWVTVERFSPEDLSRASIALFATRWVTHFCAPTFFLLSGIGIGILRARGRSPADLSPYLLTRGAWLLVLELVITPIGWQFGFQLIPAFALVLWALGWSMIIMALVVHLPIRVIATISILVIAGHHVLDPIRPESLGAFAGLWRILHVPGFILGVMFVAYPLVPWAAVMSLGYVLSVVYDWEAHRRYRFLITCGLATTALFVLLRALNAYGNPTPWTSQATPLLTIASLLNVRKYPPSLDFLLMTLGPALVGLALAERTRRARIAGWLAFYGRVPLFFYTAHIFVAHALAVMLAFLQGGELRRIQVVNNPGAIPDWYGLSLPGVYLMWAIVVLLLFYPCRWFAGLKNTRSDWWLRYM